MKNLTTEKRSRILLTVLILSAMAPAAYWISAGLPIYGTLLFVGGAVLLAWLWWPRGKTKA